MSDRTVEQVKALITAELSAVEKAQLVEWLGLALRQELLAGEATQPREGTHQNGANGFAETNELTPQNEIPWEEQPWTEEELRELMRPDPKTGAEIVELLDRLDLSEWEAMDIPDVVEWLSEQRRQETQRRTQQWAKLP
ncbi:MAG: hypothetical protein R3E79_49745 [Caldilineaceae bacterium]